MAKLYKTYRFKNQDPALAELLNHVAESGMTKAAIERISGVTTQTLRNWEHKKTLRAQHPTMAAVYGAIGMELRPMRVNKRSL
jgi:transcriptional regulator with XRE-family HTH domain